MDYRPQPGSSVRPMIRRKARKNQIDRCRLAGGAAGPGQALHVFHQNLGFEGLERDTYDMRGSVRNASINLMDH